MRDRGNDALAVPCGAAKDLHGDGLGLVVGLSVLEGMRYLRPSQITA